MTHVETETRRMVAVQGSAGGKCTACSQQIPVILRDSHDRTSEHRERLRASPEAEMAVCTGVKATVGEKVPVGLEHTERDEIGE